MHDDIRIDNYYWLRDDSRKNKEIKKLLNEENKYTNSILQKNIKLELFQEMLERTAKQKIYECYQYNDYLYRTIYEKNKNYPIYQRKLINEKKDKWQLLVDCNKRAQNKYYNLKKICISENNKYLAITEDLKGNLQHFISLKEINSKNWKNKIIKNTSGDIVWAGDNKTLFYIKNNSNTILPYQVNSYQYDIDKNKKIYQEKDNEFFLSLSKSRSKKYIFIIINSTETSEYRLINANNLNKPIKIFLPRKKKHEYVLNHFQNFFYIKSNYESNQFGLYRTKLIDDIWENIVKPKKNVYLEEFKLFNSCLIIKQRKNRFLSIKKINWINKKEKVFQHKESIYTICMGHNPESSSNYFNYYYSSLITPKLTFQIDLKSNKKKLIKQEKIKNFNKNNYINKIIWVQTKDKIKIPISLAYRKNLFKKQKNSILLHGYGSYGLSLEPTFNSNIISLLDRGFIYGLIHVRGGGELGKKWYDQGKTKNKKNSFNDFINCTKGILSQGYGNKKKVYAIGGSAGGLLMGVIINECPDLYKGIIAKVPFVDILTTMLDPSIPLTTNEYNEWGNPNKKEDYLLIKSYSPYDNIKKQIYPHLLVTASLYDSQVQYWEPFKWVAKIREHKKSNSILLFKINMKSGHKGNSGRFNILKETSLEYSFLLMLENNAKY